MLPAGRLPELIPAGIVAERGGTVRESSPLAGQREASNVDRRRREPHGRAGPELTEPGMVGGDCHGGDRVAAGRLVVGQEDDRRPAGRHLDRAP